MSDELTLLPIFAEEELTCFQCFNIGLPILGIAKGQYCMEIRAPGKLSYACMDCFERLNTEIKKLKAEEEIDDEQENDF